MRSKLLAAGFEYARDVCCQKIQFLMLCLLKSLSLKAKRKHFVMPTFVNIVLKFWGQNYHFFLNFTVSQKRGDTLSRMNKGPLYILGNIVFVTVKHTSLDVLICWKSQIPTCWHDQVYLAPGMFRPGSHHAASAAEHNSQDYERRLDRPAPGALRQFW